MLQIQAYIVM